jgi:hypothetical protein
MRIERRRLAAVLMTAGVLLLGHAAELAAQTRVPWWRRIILPNPRIDATSSYTQHRVPFSVELWRVNGVTSDGYNVATAYADFNGDGQTDMALMPIRFDGQPNEPVILTGLADNSFTDISSSVLEGPLPALRGAFRALVADFNRDGRPDLYYASACPRCEDTNVLLLSTSSGKLRWASTLVEPVGFHEGVSAADIDNDRDVDIFVSDGGFVNGARVPGYFLVNDGLGNFTIDTTRVPTGFGDGLVLSAELIDIDRDGYLDLVVGGHEFEGRTTTIFWGGLLGFRNAPRTTLPAVPGYGIVLDIEADDVDGDGRKDVVVTRTKDSPFYEGYYFQVLRQTSRRAFADQSAARIIGDPGTWEGAQSGQQAVFWIRLVDTNGDGARDILLDDKGRGLGWLNDGVGNFTFRSPW